MSLSFAQQGIKGDKTRKVPPLAWPDVVLFWDFGFSLRAPPLFPF